MSLLDAKSDLIEYKDDYFEIDYAEYPVSIIYSYAYDGDIDVMSCVIDLGAGVKVNVNETSLDAIKPELLKRLKRNLLDELNNTEVA